MKDLAAFGKYAVTEDLTSDGPSNNSSSLCALNCCRGRESSTLGWSPWLETMASISSFDCKWTFSPSVFLLKDWTIWGWWVKVRKFNQVCWPRLFSYLCFCLSLYLSQGPSTFCWESEALPRWTQWCGPSLGIRARTGREPCLTSAPVAPFR